MNRCTPQNAPADSPDLATAAGPTRPAVVASSPSDPAGSARPHALGRRAFVAGALATGAMLALAGCGASSDGASDAASGSADDGEAPRAASSASSAADASATSSASADAAARRGGTFTFAITNPVSIDPYNVNENQGSLVSTLLFDCLTTYDFKAGKLVGAAAESWEANDDATEFTFHLRPGMTFHNGDPVDAASFARGWNRLCSPGTDPDNPSTVSSYINMVGGYDDVMAGTSDTLDVECPDELTFVVRLTYPFADFPLIASRAPLAPVPQAALDDYDAFRVAPIGNGPFAMDGEWVDGQYINLVRFEDYGGTKPLVDGISFQIFKDETSAYVEWQAGNLDLTTIPSGQIESVKSQVGAASDGYTAQPGAQVIDGPALGTWFLVLNNEDEKLSDPVLRRALSCAVNRQAICDTVWEGAREPAVGIVPPTIGGADRCGWDDCAYDKARAAELLDEAGYPAGSDGTRDLVIALSYNTGNGNETIMQMVQADFEALGITVEAQGMEMAAYLDELRADYQVGRLGWDGGYPSLDTFFYSLFSSASENNFARYHNDEVDEKIVAARAIADDAAREDAYVEISRIVGEELPVIPIAYYNLSYVSSARVHDLYVKPSFSTDLEGAWLEEE